MSGLRNIILKLKYILTRQQVALSGMVFAFTLLGSLFECLGVSAIIPIVNIIVDPEGLSDSFVCKIFPFIASMQYKQQVITIIAGVVALYLIKNIFFMFLSWLRNKYACKIQRDISVSVMKSYMSRGYEFFLTKNYGQLYQGISGDISGVYTVILNMFYLASDGLTSILVCIVLVITDWQLTLIMAVLAMGCVGLIYVLFRRRMYEVGQKRRKLGAVTAQVVSQSMQGIKDVLTLRKQKYFVTEYEDAMINQQAMQVKFNLAVECPTYIIEGICISGIMIAIGIRVLMGGDMTALMTSLATLAVGAFRILPYLSKISAEMNNITQAAASLEAVYNDMKESEEYRVAHPEVDWNLIDDSQVDRNREYFTDKLELKDITFAYRGEDGNPAPVLRGVNLVINKGQSIALIGPTGAGKSTLVDVLLGLLVPQEGKVYSDGKNITDIPNEWSKIVGYVPQSVFLCDATIRENVAFGEAKDGIDDSRVEDALKRADLADFILTLPEGVNTFVGDRGVRLSGGQRQRIAIARALYHNPEVLVLDEATSALDNETESVIMDAIDSLHGDVTMIIIAHRLTTVRNCDVIYEVKNGGITVKDKKEIFG